MNDASKWKAEYFHTIHNGGMLTCKLPQSRTVVITDVCKLKPWFVKQYKYSNFERQLKSSSAL